MQRLVNRVATGVYVAAFALFCLAASPVILFHFGVSANGDRIEALWPNSERARVASFWLRLLAPVVLLAVMAVAFEFAIAHLRSLKQAEPGAAAYGGS